MLKLEKQYSERDFINIVPMYHYLYRCGVDFPILLLSEKLFLNFVVTVKKKKYIYPLLILYVCPLTKKLSVYNFNGRFIRTVRDRITKNKSRKTHLKNVIHLFAF